MEPRRAYRGRPRVDLQFYLYAIPGLGVLLIYHKYGGVYWEAYTPKGEWTACKNGCAICTTTHFP